VSNTAKAHGSAVSHATRHVRSGVVDGTHREGEGSSVPRHFRPISAIDPGTLLSHAFYWIAPIVGAVIAAGAWKQLTTEEVA